LRKEVALECCRKWSGVQTRPMVRVPTALSTMLTAEGLRVFAMTERERHVPQPRRRHGCA
jgi:hypothetical protein